LSILVILKDDRVHSWLEMRCLQQSITPQECQWHSLIKCHDKMDII